MRVAYVVLPLACACLASAVFVRLPALWEAPVLLRWAVVLAASTGVLVGAHRALSRLLPLAALLELSVQFSGPAPSRYAVARDAGNPLKLQEIVARAQRGDRLVNLKDAEAARDILALVSALRGHDARTRGHSERVRVYTDLIAVQLHIPLAEREHLRWAALLHDVGKLSVPGAVLNGRPAPREVRRHRVPAGPERRPDLPGGTDRRRRRCLRRHDRRPVLPSPDRPRGSPARAHELFGHALRPPGGPRHARRVHPTPALGHGTAELARRGALPHRVPGRGRRCRPEHRERVRRRRRGRLGPGGDRFTVRRTRTDGVEHGLPGALHRAPPGTGRLDGPADPGRDRLERTHLDEQPSASPTAATPGPSASGKPTAPPGKPTPSTSPSSSPSTTPNTTPSSTPTKSGKPSAPPGKPTPTATKTGRPTAPPGQSGR